MPDSAVAIDRLRDSDGGLDRQALQQILPYGEEFLFVDRVTRLESAVVEATYQIPQSAPFLDAHFVGLPLMLLKAELGKPRAK